MENARIKENIGGSRHRYYWESFGKRGFLSTDLMSSGEAVSTWDHIKKWIKDVFLPQGYPDSVSADYLEYQLWDTFQVMCSSLNTSLLLHSTLEASGVGKENASALSATLAWMLRDVSFMFATILFTYAKSTHMSSNCKQWRLFADLANDVALTLKLFSPIIPLPLNLTMSLIGIILALVSAPVVPANTALASHQARRGNLADVQAKNGSQAKLVRLVALGLSAGLISHVSHSFQYKVITSFILMGLHIFANYKAKRIVRIETLNRPRLLILLEKWFSVTRIPSVEEANKSEPLFFGAAYKQNYLPYGFRLKIGSSLREALNSIGETEAFHQFQNLYSSFRHENYMLLADFQKKKIFLMYHENISPEEELKGFFVAYLCMLHYISMEKNIQIANVNTTGMEKSTPGGEIINKVKTSSHALYQDFRKAAIEKGWKMDPVHLSPDECRYRFTQDDFIQEDEYTRTN